ncbi:hypothetical protein BDW22DRAFT_1409467 [Trametopsis cervina]|nr:hypothetical protein BDW22DRAFT_1409467 [Trametopsis cervina]
MLSVLKPKAFDLDVLCSAWPDAPRFEGNSKKDMKVDLWLESIKQGCMRLKVSKKYWHAVAERYMGEHACHRLSEVKKVMVNLSKGSFTWNWRKFVVAMKNMNWHIDTKRSLSFRVSTIPGLWWIAPGDTVKQAETVPNSVPSKPFLKRTLRSKSDAKATTESAGTTKATPKALTKSKKDISTKAFPDPAPKQAPWTLFPTRKPEEPEVRVANAPEWLLAACQSLDAISNEYPNTMSVIAAVLITVGSVPSLPVAAGTALASGTAHALGSLAVGVGSWMRAQQTGNVALS